HVVKATRRKAAVEMPQSRNDYSDHGNLDVGTRLIEHKEIEPALFSNIHTGHHLFARVQTPKLPLEIFPDGWFATRRQIRIVLQTQGRGAIEARFVTLSAAHQTNGQELVQFRQCAQQGNARVEMRARTKLDVLLSVFDPVRDRDEGRNS